jgi:hypothetical protein
VCLLHQEVTKLQHDLGSLAASLSDDHDRVCALESRGEVEGRAMCRALRDKQREFRDAIASGLSKLKDNGDACLTDIRNVVVGLEDQVGTGVALVVCGCVRVYVRVSISVCVSVCVRARGCVCP